MMADSLDDLRVGKRRDVSNVGEVGARSKDPAHDFARAGFGHICNDPDIPRSRDRTNLRLNCPGHLCLNVLTRVEPRLQCNVHLNNPTAKLVYERYRSGLGNLFDGEACRLNFFRAESVPGHIDYIIDSAKDAEIAIGCQNRTVTSEVWPIMPVFTVFVPSVLLIVDLHKA